MTLPILDHRQAHEDPDGFAAALGAACRGPGFFLLANHPIPQDLLDRVHAGARAFFAQPAEAKAPLSILKNPHNRGWAAEGTERLDAASGLPDRKEAFNIGLDLAPDDPRVLRQEPFRGVNVWPEAVPDFRAATLAYFDAALDLGRDLLGAVARDLGLPQDTFAPHFTAPMATLRLLSYPAASGAADEIGAGAHTDYGALTLLATDGEPGLQVRPRGGDWTCVPHVPGALVVNIGDCLMRWTGDLYVSTPHRVLPPRRPRMSIAFFLDPNPDAMISVLPGTGGTAYSPISGADHLRARLDATYPERPA